MKYETIESLAVQSITRMAKEHKEKCRNKYCEISLSIIRIYLEEKGVKLNEEQKDVFV